MTIFACFTLLALAFLSHAFYLQNKRYWQLKEEIYGISKTSLEESRDHDVLVQADLLFAKQLQEITKQLTSMDNQLQNLANQRDNDGGYQHALHILNMGGNREEIIESCHLSSAEADLLMNLHAYQAVMETNKA